MSYKVYSESRISGLQSKPFLSFDLPLAGQFLTKEEVGTESCYPLTLSFCEASSSIQVNEIIDANILFKKYLYKTGTIKTLLNHLQKTASIISDKFKISKIADLGCNDFSFLKNFLGKSDLIRGVDPSDVSFNNVPDGCVLENDFFSNSKSDELKNKHGEFDLIFSSNNFAHIENIRDYTAGISNLLSEDGSFVCEVHWAGTVIQNLQFCFIYHEHMYYHTLKSLKYLLEKEGLYINNVEEIEIHGGSIRFFASKKKFQSQSVKDFLKKEEELGLYDFQTYKNFASKINILKENSQNFFKECKQNNHRVFGYGASGQANTLMNVFGIDSSDLEFIIDDSPLKEDLFTPINNIQIKNKDFLHSNVPDYIYILAYTFSDEIINKNNDLKCKWEKAV